MKRVTGVGAAKWLCFIVLGLGLGLICAYASSSRDKPRLVLEADRIDFGRLGIGGTSTRTISVSNSGARELLIERIVPSCGCSSVAISSSRVLPGAAAVLTVSVQGGASPGRTTADLVLVSNDPTKRMAKVALEFFTATDIFMEPSAVDFGRVDRGQLPVTRTVQIQFGKELRHRASEAIQVVCKTNDFSAKYRAGNREGELLLDVELTQFARSGQHKVELELRSPDGQVTISIPVHGFVRGEVYGMPAAVILGPLRQDSVTTEKAEITVRGRTGKVTPKRATLTTQLDEYLQIHILEDTIVLTPRFVPLARQRVDGNLTIHVVKEDGGNEDLSVPVALFFELSEVDPSSP